MQTDGSRDILGLWIEGAEGAKFWMKVFNDLRTRGVADILIAMTDGLKGMQEALATVFPATTLQTCIVHLIRNSLDYASWKDRTELAAAIKPIYAAASAEAAQAELDNFAQGHWSQKFPTVTAAWQRAWDKVIPFVAFPPNIRKVIYTTNAIESVNAQLRKIIKTRGHFRKKCAVLRMPGSIGCMTRSLPSNPPTFDSLRVRHRSKNRARLSVLFPSDGSASHTAYRLIPRSTTKWSFLRCFICTITGTFSLVSWSQLEAKPWAWNPNFGIARAISSKLAIPSPLSMA